MVQLGGLIANDLNEPPSVVGPEEGGRSDCRQIFSLLIVDSKCRQLQRIRLKLLHLTLNSACIIGKYGKT